MDEFFKELFSRRRGRIKPGLERVRKARHLLGDPLKTIPQVLIAGTNGKGTTAGWLAKILDVHGFHLGLFSSPHLVSFKERFQSNRRQTNDTELMNELNSMRHSLGTFFDELTFFELSTLLAMQLFEKWCVDVAIIEIGLGGRWDAANCLEPEVSIVTSIGLDHTEWLGDTKEKILKEKIQIARPDKPLVLSSSIARQESLLQVAIEELDAIGSRLVHVDFNDLTRIQFGDRAPPSWYRENFFSAVTAFQYVRESLNKKKIGRPYPDEYLNWYQKAQETFFWPNVFNGRNQKLLLKGANKTREAIIDIGHNTEAVQNFLNGIDHQIQHCSVALISLFSDKNVDQIVSLFKNKIGRVILFAMKSDRCDSNQLESVAAKNQVEFSESFSNAWHLTEKMKQDEKIIIAGSFGAVAEALEFFGAELKTAETSQAFFIGTI